VRFAKTKSRHGKGREQLHLGFVATIDSAIPIAAQELRLFDKYGFERSALAPGRLGDDSGKGAA